MPNNPNQLKRGVVILFAVLLVSVVLTVSLGLFNITYRQLVLSSLASESEVAFAVADSARNCALFWDSPERPSHPFGYYQYDQTAGGWLPLNLNDTPIFQCAGQEPRLYRENQGSSQTDQSNLGESRFYLRINIGSRQACADVTVVKNMDGSDQKTVITVDGYNISKSGSPDSSCVPTDINRAVQRRIQTVING